MKKALGISVLIILVTFWQSCKEKPVPPVLSTNEISEISTASAVSGGVIADDGGSTIIARGVCWSTSDNPTIEKSKTAETGQSASFTSNLTQLTPKTTYYVRAYATNTAGTGYGKSVSFATLGDKPGSNGQNTSNIQLSSVTLSGLVNPNSLATAVNFEWGLTDNYGNSVPCIQGQLTGDDPVNVSADLTGLTPGTTYHFRIRAENSLGVSYSNDMIFKTLGDLPAATPLTATGIQVSSATINGSVNPNYLSTKVDFEWGKTAAYGSTIAYPQSPVTDNSFVHVAADLLALSPGTIYHFRVRAENSLGITYSSDMTFKTLGDVPAAIILNSDNIHLRSSVLNGTVNPNYVSSAVIFEWGTTISYGNTITVPQSPLTGNVPVTVSANLSGLLPGTTYHVRIKAENSIGASYSNDTFFTTPEMEWTKASDFPGEARSNPLSFTFNGKGYFGLGRNSLNPANDNLKDFWTFDPATSAWTRLGDCPFSFISGLTKRCLVGTILYVFKEWALYSYDLSSDTWQFVCNTPISFTGTSGFSVNNKVFSFNGSSGALFEFDPLNKVFNRKNAAIDGFQNWSLNETFVVNNEAYLIHKQDLKVAIYHYISQSDTWEKKAERDFPNSAFFNASFIITVDNCAFIGQSTSFTLSSMDDDATVSADNPSSNVWKYDCVRNEFKQVVSLPGEFRAQAGCFSFNNTGLVVSGVTIDQYTQRFRYLNDIWILNR